MTLFFSSCAPYVPHSCLPKVLSRTTTTSPALYSFRSGPGALPPLQSFTRPISDQLHLSTKQELRNGKTTIQHGTRPRSRCSRSTTHSRTTSRSTRRRRGQGSWQKAVVLHFPLRPPHRLPHRPSRYLPLDFARRRGCDPKYGLHWGFLLSRHHFWDWEWRVEYLISTTQQRFGIRQQLRKPYLRGLRLGISLATKVSSTTIQGMIRSD